MMKVRLVVLLLFPLLLVGCRRYDFSVSQQIINRDYLASTHVCTPDPRQACPPCGRRLIMSWHIPRDILNRCPQIELDIIYWDYSEGHFSYPITEQKGYVLYSLLNEEYHEKKGLLSYKARIITADGYVYRTWKQQLWVDLIHIDETPFQPPSKPINPHFPHKT